MTIRTRLSLVLFGLGLLALAVSLLGATHALNRLEEVAVAESRTVLRQRGEQTIRERAQAVAREIRLYLEHHPEVDLADATALQADEELSLLAVQPVGETGYTALLDERAVVHCHANPQFIGLDMNTLSEEQPALWTIVAAALDGTPSEGYYDGQEAGGQTRPRFMAVVPVAGTPLRVAATTYIDEFSQPIEALSRELEETSGVLRLRVGINTGLAALAVAGIAFAIGTFLTRPAQNLARAAEGLGQKGDWALTEHPMLDRQDELGTLSRALNGAHDRIHELVRRLEERVAERTQALQLRTDELNTMYEEQKGLLDAIREISTPVIPVTEEILVMPLVGVIDDQRTQQIVAGLLAAVEEQQARVVIVDITGVPMVDSAVAEALLRTARAVRLLGAKPILVGITPQVAETVVSLGLDLKSLDSKASLQAALKAVLLGGKVGD